MRKVHRVIKFNQKAWIKSYIDMITELRINATNDFKKDFFKLMNNAVFGKTLENVKKRRDIKLVTTEARRNYLVPKQTIIQQRFFWKFISHKNEQAKTFLMNKPVYLGLSILEISKIVMYEFWYDYLKQKYGKRAKLGHKYRDNFIVYIKTEDIYSDIAKHVESRHDTSNYKLNRPLSKRKNKELI